MINVYAAYMAQKPSCPHMCVCVCVVYLYKLTWLSVCVCVYTEHSIFHHSRARKGNYNEGGYQQFQLYTQQPATHPQKIFTDNTEITHM